MKNPITKENMFENKIIESILYLLSEFKDEGLQPRYIRFALQKEYTTQKEIENDTELERNIEKMKMFFGDRLEILEQNHLIERDCINSREHLKYYLEKLGEYKDGLGVIKKEGKHKKTKYFIKDGAYIEVRRFQNKECLYFFPQEKIKFFPIKYPSGSVIGGHMIYGLSDELLNNIFSQDDKGIIEKNLEKIDVFLDEISEIKVKRIYAEWDRRIDIFLKITKSKNIKNLLRDKGNRGDFWGVLFNQIALNLYSSDIDICSSKTLFFFAFGIAIKREINPQGISIRMEISNAMDKIINSKNKKLLNENFKAFCKIWSLTFFNEDYNLLLSDIKELIQFGWDNKDFFKLCIPTEIAYSRYNVYNEYSLTSTLEK